MVMGADPNIQDYEGNNIAHVAAMHGNEQVILQLKPFKELLGAINKLVNLILKE